MADVDRDLQAVLFLALVAAAAVFLPPLSNSTLRVVFGLPFVLFLPGYALIAALFPGRGDLDGIERVALSFGLSIAVVPLIGLILNYTPYGIRIVPVAVSLFTFTVALSLVAQRRRNALPGGERFKVVFDVGGWFELGSESGGFDRVLNLFLILSILLAVGALVYVVVSPKQGERFTEFYILGEGGRAAGYPEQLVLGREIEVLVGVVNQEYEAVNYTLEVSLSNSTLYRREVFLSHNESWIGPVAFAPESLGEDLKLEFLLYKNASGELPYRSLHLWVDVVQSSGMESS